MTFFNIKRRDMPASLGAAGLRPPPKVAGGDGRWIELLCGWMIGWSVCCLGLLGSSHAQEVKVWEYSPYEVTVWYHIDPTVSLSAHAQEAFGKSLREALERTYRAAWNVEVQPLPHELRSSVGRSLENMTIDQLTASELVLVVASENDKTRAVRTFDAALSALETIVVTPTTQRRLQQSVDQLQLAEDSPAQRLVSKLHVESISVSQLIDKLRAREVDAVLVPRNAIEAGDASLRAVNTPLPWQTDNLFRKRDKVFFLNIQMLGDDHLIRGRELDCPMQFFGPTIADRTYAWSYVPRVATDVVTRAFAPTARVEDATSFAASLQLKAGGLIIDESNPARVGVGEVMQPIIRRDDRNGVPTLLEPLPWTFAAITDTDGIRMQANVYTYSGGPGLQGRKNRRTQRILLRVRPQQPTSDLQVVIRGQASIPQSGCFVYERDLITSEFQFIGRTDWRGKLTIHGSPEPGSVLSEEVRRDRLRAEPEKVEDEQAEAASKSSEEVSDDAGTGPDELEATADPDAIQLRHPLKMLYVKSGETVLAKLPIVLGLQPVEVAELPDDRRRLQAEAFVRGFQGEILDLIGLRKLLATRVDLYLKEQRLDEANGVLDELRRLRNYTELADELEVIQRRMLDESDGAIPALAKSHIDRMFQTTRNLLQKHLQDNLVVRTQAAVAAASKQEAVTN